MFYKSVGYLHMGICQHKITVLTLKLQSFANLSKQAKILHSEGQV